MSPPIIHVVCGVGGAGKTTTAAAMGVAAARAGHRAVVLTIDPARRLADALGIAHLGNEPQPIPVPRVPDGGSLHALMLDRKATWDALVRDHADDDALIDRLLANRYYDAVSTRLTGGHEWMAVEKLYRLVQADRWDVILVDTPPAQHALDFLQAPERIARMLDGGLVRTVLQPGGGLLGSATKRAVGVVRRLAGDSVLTDLQEFFQLVSGLSDAFRDRGEAIRQLLHGSATRYWLVAPADGPRTPELVAFDKALRHDGLAVHGVLLNRLVPQLASRPAALDAAIPSAPEGVSEAEWTEVVGWIRARLDERHARAERHRITRDQVGRALGLAPVALPEVEGGIRDVHGLVALTYALPDLG